MKYYIAVRSGTAQMTGYATDASIGELATRFDYIIVCDTAQEAKTQLNGLMSVYVQR